MSINQQLIQEPLIDAYMDYRRFHYSKIKEVLHQVGILTELQHERSVSDLMRCYQFVEGRSATLEALLNAMIKLGVAKRNQDDTYVLAQNEIGSDVDLQRAQQASGEQALQQHSDIANLALNYLKGENNSIEFTHEFGAFWKALLEAPFYAQGRMKSVERVAERNVAHVLDMASGQGHALVEIAHLVGPGARIYGIEYSHDHIEMARDLVARNQLQNVEIKQGDLNDGIAYGTGQFEGILFIGALHFITNREYLIQEIARVARVGATIAIGNVYSDLDTFDRPFMDLIFSMIEPRALPVSVPKFYGYCEQVGLTITENVNVGCNAWYLLKKERQEISF